MWESIKEVVYIAVGGGGMGLFNWWFSRRKEKAEAGKTEVELDRARMELERLRKTEDVSEMIELVNEAKKLREERNRWLQRSTDFEVKLLEETRRRVLAEAERDRYKCTVIGCSMRIPPNGECRVEVTMPKKGKKDEVIDDDPSMFKRD